MNSQSPNASLLEEVQNELIERAWVRAEDIAAIILKRITDTSEPRPSITPNNLMASLEAIEDITKSRDAWGEPQAESLDTMRRLSPVFDESSKGDLEALNPLIQSKADKLSDELKQKLKKWGYI